MTSLQSGSYLPKLTALFFAVFDPTHGAKVVSQIPEGSVYTQLNLKPKGTFDGSPSASSDSLSAVSSSPVRSSDADGGVVRSAAESFAKINTTQVLFDFSTIVEYVIPQPEMCGNLVTIATRTCKVVGFPVRIEDERKYSANGFRNAFIFNLCFVFDREAELSGYEPLARKTGRVLRMMEESMSLLSSPPPSFEMSNFIEQLYQDLNAYSEARIPVEKSELNLALFPFRQNVREINMYDVPVTIADLEAMRDRSWDVTLYKVCSFINGVNSVQHIAELAEVELSLARQCVQHLLYFGAVLVIDLFQFSNSYAALPSISDIAVYNEEDDEDDGIGDLRLECEDYVFNGNEDESRVPFSTLFMLYSKLRPGLSVSSWAEEQRVYELPIDVRRMITYGVIKGFLRRVYAYPVLLEHKAYSDLRSVKALKRREEALEARLSGINVLHSSSRESLSSAVSNASSYTSHLGGATTTATRPQRATGAEQMPVNATPEYGSAAARTRISGASGFESPRETAAVVAVPKRVPSKLLGMLDGTHHTDEICLRFGVTNRQLEAMLGVGVGGADAGGEVKLDEDDARPSATTGTRTRHGKVVILHK